MGGDHHAGGHGHGHGHYPGYPSNVWSMTGGWYCNPRHWRRNTAIALSGIFLVCIPIAMKSIELEVNDTYFRSFSHQSSYFFFFNT